MAEAVQKVWRVNCRIIAEAQESRSTLKSIHDMKWIECFYHPRPDTRVWKCSIMEGFFWKLEFFLIKGKCVDTLVWTIRVAPNDARKFVMSNHVLRRDNRLPGSSPFYCRCSCWINIASTSILSSGFLPLKSLPLVWDDNCGFPANFSELYLGVNSLRLAWVPVWDGILQTKSQAHSHPLLTKYKKTRIETLSKPFTLVFIFMQQHEYEVVTDIINSHGYSSRYHPRYRSSIILQWRMAPRPRGNGWRLSVFRTCGLQTDFGYQPPMLS